MTRLEIINKIIKDDPLISVIVLNFNREYLLRNTVLSLLAGAKLRIQLFIIDNASTDGSRDWIKLFEKTRKDSMDVEAIFMNENLGGEAINYGIERAKGEYVLVSENDLEYLPGWDLDMIVPFYGDEDLGQLSPFAPVPWRETGEEWVEKPFNKVYIKDLTYYFAKENIGTTCMVPRAIYDQGVRWGTLVSGQMKFPGDSAFSGAIRKLGYSIAWSEKYCTINWGHIPSTWNKDIDYFRKNWDAKSRMDIDGMGSWNAEEDQPNENLKDQMEILKVQNYNLKREIDAFREKDKSSTVGYAQLYVDTGHGFSEAQSLKHAVQKNANTIVWNLDKYQEIINLRFDPLNDAVAIYIHSILGKDRDGNELTLTAFPLEAEKAGNNFYIYEITDPQIIIKHPEIGSLSELEIKIEYVYIGMEVSGYLYRSFKKHPLVYLYKKTINNIFRNK